ncbi:hypothetical protein [Fluviicola sp.]|uniref:hypothetical protein n=1 Tax=Fluviicola sp. TaxID=1917219 RepID=UPI0031E1DE8F
MSRCGIIPFIAICLFLSGCHKENGKRRYEIQLLFNNGDVLKDYGTVTEKEANVKKYHGKAVYTTVFNDYLFLKVNGKFICSGDLIADGKHGDLYLEGAYTQKGRAYTVEDGYFEVIWRDVYGEPLTNSVLTGKWTFKRN